MTPEQELDLLMAEPEEPVYFKLGYPDTPKTYSYVAVEAGGKWYLTGPDSPQAVSWARLIGWVKGKNATIHEMYTTTKLEDLL